MVKFGNFSNARTFYHKKRRKIKSKNSEKNYKVPDFKMVKFTNSHEKPPPFDKSNHETTGKGEEGE